MRGRRMIDRAAIDLLAVADALPAHHLQIITLDQLFQGKRPDIPLVDPTAFRRPGREDTSKQHNLL